MSERTVTRQAYPIGETITVGEQWRADGQCGAGLHFGPTPRHARDYFDGATRFLACRIPVDAASGIPDGTAKIKAQSCVVLYEVDIDGERLPDIAEAAAS